MKTIFLVLIPLILFSGCVHRVPAGHAIHDTIPLSHKAHFVKKEHTYSQVCQKNVYREKARYTTRHIVRPKPHTSYVMNQRIEMKRREIITPKVHPRYYDRKHPHIKSKKERGKKKRRTVRHFGN